MAYETGTATNYLDLLSKIRTFCLAQGWTVDRWSGGTELIMHSPDGAYIGFQAYAGTDYYNFLLNGFIGYDAGLTFAAQPGAIGNTELPRLHLWNSATPYWLMVDDRRLLLVAKVATVYESCYLGFIDVFGSPGQFPYPLFIGGTSTAYHGERWSASGVEHAAFFDCAYHTENTRGSCLMRFPDGFWRTVANKQLGGAVDLKRVVWPWGTTSSTAYATASPANIRDNAVDGSYVRIPATVLATAPTTNVWGELRGVFFISAFGNGPENTVTIGADTYLVVPNVNRSGNGDSMAVKLG